MLFRTAIFWIHLVTGVIAGVVIGIMSLTGAALAFEKEMVAWAERDARRVEPPSADATRLPVETLLANVRAAQPNLKPSTVTLFSEPDLAVLVSQGRTNACYVNPYTGEVRAQGAPQLRRFLQVMIDWHRWLGMQGDNRPLGKGITGAANATFCFLAISGLYLWWPRRWSASVLRGIALFKRGLKGRARDWNWHNVIGVWTAPVLIILTATALPISYQWAGNLIYFLTGSEAPAPMAMAGARPEPSRHEPSPAGARAPARSNMRWGQRRGPKSAPRLLPPPRDRVRVLPQRSWFERLIRKPRWLPLKHRHFPGG